MGEKSNVVTKCYEQYRSNDTQLEDVVRFILRIIDNWGYLQNEIARGIGISESYLSKILSRKASYKTTARTLNEIIDYLGTEAYEDNDIVTMTKKYGLSGRYERTKHLRELDKQSYLLSHVNRQELIGEIVEAIPKADNKDLLKIKELILK